MPKKKEEDEVVEPVVLWECDRPRCGYKIYDAGNDADNSAEAAELQANHTWQHDDPEGWKAAHQPETEEVDD